MQLIDWGWQKIHSVRWLERVRHFNTLPGIIKLDCVIEVVLKATLSLSVCIHISPLESVMYFALHRDISSGVCLTVGEGIKDLRSKLYCTCKKVKVNEQNLQLQNPSPPPLPHSEYPWFHLCWSLDMVQSESWLSESVL